MRDRLDVQPQEIFLDKLSRDREGISERKMEVPLSQNSFRFLTFCLILVMLILFSRSFQLQIVAGKEYAKMSERNRFAYSAIDNARGIIYDKNMEQLIFNQSKFSLVLDKEEFNQEKIDQLASVSGLKKEEILELISESSSDHVTILQEIPREELIVLEVKTRNLSGVSIENNIVRDYLYPEIFSHIIGYTGRISADDPELENYSKDAYIGQSGLERYYEKDLRVSPGKIKIEKDVRGNILTEEVESMAQSGDDLVLWIDGELQKKLYQTIEETLSAIGSKTASAVAIDPRTGGVLAIVSYPGYDNNIFTKGKGLETIFEDSRNPLFNRAVAGTYSVGSTIKPIIGLAALEEGIVTKDKEFYSPGYLSVPNPWNPSNPSVYADLAPNGWYNVSRAIAMSCNVYFYIVGGGYENQIGLGANLIKKYLNLFGWGSLTGIDLPGEKPGFIPDPDWKKETLNDNWRVGDSYNLAIGQGYMSATPLQVASAFTAIANKGELLKSMIVQKVLDRDGNLVRENKREVISNDLVGSANLKIIREAMKGTVDYGSASTFQSLPVSWAAKTGTAQIPKKGYYNNWVTVFAPYDNPEIVLTILIEEVEGVRAATLPVAKEALEWYFKGKNLTER